MDFGKVKGMTVGDAAQSAATEGGAVIAGLLSAGFVGKRVELIIKPNVTAASPILDKVLAYVGNNGTKMILYMLTRGQSFGGYGKDMGKGMLGSVVLDTLMRSGSNFAPGTTFKLFNYDIMAASGTSNASSAPQLQGNVQQILQDNSSLRQQLNNALQKLATAAPNVTITPLQPSNFPADHDRKYGMMQSTPEAEDRRKNFGAMTPPLEDERNKKYGAMNKSKLNFAGESDAVAASFGML